MIVKNEQDNLKKSLISAVNIVDEIVIVDTGSQDQTKKIALEFTDKVYDFKWCKDFGKARNFSISKATNDWILILDADEEIKFCDRESIRNFITEGNNKLVGRIIRKSIMDLGPDIKEYSECINRLFHRKYFFYEGTIHEQVVNIDGIPFETKNVDINIDHLGYTKEALNKTNKLLRNIKLLNEALTINSKDPYLRYQLGKSYYLLKDYNTAIINFEKAMSFDLNYKLEYVSNLMESYGYSLINSERYVEALNLENYIKYYDNADFYFLMGLVYMNNAKFTLAVESFLKCSKFKNSKVQGITSYLSFYNIGVIFDVLDFREKAVEYYRMCGNYEMAIERIKCQLN
ncbi:glycosyltransferase family 2 protein [Clostridium estertheticum]|uniref:glycosyltransferase family 2 protein n=1 Tax=Clostridium estertheticum TaxID=238834 RepID=UPI0021F3EDC0|nr:glycosyltransferase family 2 protein [Clostridium estertheticum]